MLIPTPGLEWAIPTSDWCATVLLVYPGDNQQSRSMTDSNDELGDVLRRFYGSYGVPNEGPPAGVDVSALFPAPTNVASDVQILERVMKDERLLRQFRNCRDVLDDLATRLTSEELLRELVGIPLPTGSMFEQLSNGVFWFSLAGTLDSREEGLPKTPFDEVVDLPLGAKIHMVVQGSLVLRLYIALVYMREGVLSDLIDASARAGGPCSGRVKKLLNCDYLRRIRNALAHGSFAGCIAGIVFSDDDGSLVATPGFLNWLSTWLMLVQLQALAACTRKLQTT